MSQEITQNQVAEQTCHKVHRATGAVVTIRARHSAFFDPWRLTPEQARSRMNDTLREIEEAVRDSKILSYHSISTELETVTLCSACGHEWKNLEHDPDEPDQRVACSWCGAILTAQEGAKP